MKILVFNSYPKKGGAARAASRLCESLVSLGVDVEYVSAYQESLTPYQKLKWLARALYDRLPAIIVSKKKTLFSSGGFRNRVLIDEINSSNADLVHLHWVNAGAIAISDIARITKPIVWSLHDMWPFTGGCHYDDDCGRYTASCGACPFLSSSSEKDLSRSVINEKLYHFSRINNITIVGLSRWLATCAQKSNLFSRARVVNIPNPIDTNFFKPQPHEEAKKQFGLLGDRKIILFGAISSTDDERKGYGELLTALNSMDLSEVDVLVFGSNGTNDNNTLNIKYLGAIHDDKKLALLYSVADVMVVPSLQENLSNAIMESMACGTPVVAFNIGGNPDMIDHKVNGYLAKPFDPIDLAEGIRWVLSSSNHDEIRNNTRKKIVDCFDKYIVGNRYIELYKEILKK